MQTGNVGSGQTVETGSFPGLEVKQGGLGSRAQAVALTIHRTAGQTYDL